VGCHGTNEAHVQSLALRLPVVRLIVNQAHAIAAGGAFDDGLPFSLSIGCGS
jgi:sulfoacetaldehyde dehydrogenase